MAEREFESRRTDHVHEHASDPADTANRPLEERSSGETLHETDTPHPQESDPHHSLNTPVGEVDPTADSDPYRASTPEDESDRASGITGEGSKSEDR